MNSTQFKYENPYNYTVRDNLSTSVINHSGIKHPALLIVTIIIFVLFLMLLFFCMYIIDRKSDNHRYSKLFDKNNNMKNFIIPRRILG